MAVAYGRQKGEKLKKVTYYCDRCLTKLGGMRHKITARDGAGRNTKYGVLLDEIDLCEDCMAKVTLEVLDGMKTDAPEESTKGQQDNESQAERQQGGEEQAKEQQETAKRQQETAKGQQEHKEEPDKKTVACSKAIKTCRYAQKADGRLCCDYISVAGHSRGCDPEQCDKYEKVIRKRGPKKKTERGAHVENMETEME